MRGAKLPTSKWKWLLPILLGPLLAGCAGFWDDVTSRDFSFHNFFNKPNPLVVLRDSSDGDLRAKALRSLHEPRANGGTDEQQDAVVKILTTAASSEKYPVCRLAAIQALGTFKDPRVVDGLLNAFYNASSFTAETATIVRCEALTALGQVGNPAAVDLLAKVAREPPAEGPEADRQQATDVRIAAVRALGHFHHYQATTALVGVLKTEKDVALRDRAYESLKSATGKDLPPDAVAWEQLLQQTDEHAVAEEKAKKHILAGWFE
jgi:HEAT repeat protein